MTSHDRRLFIRCTTIGAIVTALVVIADAAGALDSLEGWFYDHRAAICQFTTPPPTKQLIHLDIDDASVDSIGRWPWPRATIARILDEVQSARPTALGLDIMFSEPQPPRYVPDASGAIQKIDDDGALAASLARSGVAVLATSFDVETGATQSPTDKRITDAFADELEQSPQSFAKKIAASGMTNLDTATTNDLFLRGRHLAMKARIDRELDQGPISLAKITAQLLPHTDPDVDSPLLRTLKSEYEFSLAEHAIYRFGAPAQPMAVPPVYGAVNQVPLPIFTTGAASCAFVNYDIFGSVKVRSVPLFVQYKDRLYPQMGLATACVMIGADPTKVRFQGSTAIIPMRSGSGEITIPTYTYHSRTQGVDVSLIVAIPWFGAREWETMYDWPAHRIAAAHLSLAHVWDICESDDHVAKNNASIDKAIADILGDREDQLAQDPDKLKKYNASLSDPQDIATREQWAKETLDVLNESQLQKTYDAMQNKDMDSNDRFRRDKLHAAIKVLTNVVAENRKLHDQAQGQRRELATLVGGKGVLIGFDASGIGDRVATSLDNSCPGVVVHGVIANAVLTGRWWRVAPTWVTILLTLFLGLTTAAAQGRYHAERANAIAAGLLVCYWVLNGLVLFGLWRWIIGLAGPTIVIFTVAVVCTLFRVITEVIERIRITTENTFFQKEMSLARKVQFALIPNNPPQIEGHNADGWTLPADMTGGDLFDLWKLPDGRMGLLVADASGHGLAPAMIVSQVRTLVHMLSEYETHPHALLARVNARLALDLEAGRFVTAFLAFLSSDGKVVWASAGHGPMFWAPTGDGEMQELSSSGLPLGVQEDWFADEPSPPLQLEPTGRLIVVSDGIFEAHSPTRKLWGTDPIKEILHRSPAASSREIIDEIRRAVAAWQEKTEPVDDQTIVVVRRVASSATAPAASSEEPK